MYYTGVGGFWLGVQPRLNHVWSDAAEAGPMDTWVAWAISVDQMSQGCVQWVPRGPWVTHTRCEWVPRAGLWLGPVLGK